VIVLRADPYLGARSGFAVGFIGVGLGAVVLAVATLLRGFVLEEAFMQSLRDGWRELGYEQAKIGEMSELLATNGPLMVVVGAALLALSGGATSAVLAAWTDRRFRRRRAGQTWPPAAPPAAPQ
jgi:MFS family permease